jgi:hypothetical protein
LGREASIFRRGVKGAGLTDEKYKWTLNRKEMDASMARPRTARFVARERFSSQVRLRVKPFLRSVDTGVGSMN